MRTGGPPPTVTGTRTRRRACRASSSRTSPTRRREMAVAHFTAEGFGGQNLVDDPLEVGAAGAIDTLKAVLDALGSVRCWDGFAKLTGSALAGDVLSIAPVPIFGRILAWAKG